MVLAGGYRRRRAGRVLHGLPGLICERYGCWHGYGPFAILDRRRLQPDVDGNGGRHDGAHSRSHVVAVATVATWERHINSLLSSMMGARLAPT